METTTRGSAIENLAPDNDAIVALIEVVTEPESIDYACVKFDKKTNSISKKMVEDTQHVKATLKGLQADIHLLRASEGKHWDAKMPKSDYQNYISASSALISEELRALGITEIEMVYAMSDDSQFLLGVRSKGQGIDPKSQVLFNKLVSAHFSENNLYVDITPEETVIYENDGKGHIREREGKSVNDKEKIKADPENTKKLIKDKNKGLQTYLAKYGISSVINERPYKAQTAQAKQEAPKPARAHKAEKPISTPNSDKGSAPAA